MPIRSSRSATFGAHPLGLSRRRLLLSAAAVPLWPTTAWAAPASAPVPGASQACPPLLRHTLRRLQDNQAWPLCAQAGQVLLVVNTASECGWTPQFEGLQTLHQRYAPKGLVILGFPSDDFKSEADTPQAIAEVCFGQYGVRFPMLAPGAVSGPRAQPFWAALNKASGDEPGWNFHKVLVGRSGQLLGTYPSNVPPLGQELITAIEAALAAGR